MRQTPAIVDLLHLSGGGNPFQLAEAIYQIIQAGGSHDKKIDHIAIR